MSTDDITSNMGNILEESQIKMELIRDYLHRFKISDPRLVSPIMDIDRCLSVMDHLMGHEHDDHDYGHNHMPDGEEA